MPRPSKSENTARPSSIKTNVVKIDISGFSTADPPAVTEINTISSIMSFPTKSIVSGKEARMTRSKILKTASKRLQLQISLKNSGRFLSAPRRSRKSKSGGTP